MKHPYKEMGKRSFWSKAVSDGFNVNDLLPSSLELIHQGEAVMSAGSCFAANIVPHLEKAGIKYVWAERPHPVFENVHKESLSYHKFSAAYGNIYTPRHLLQLLKRAKGQYKPQEDRWHEAGLVIDPFRPGLAFPASSDVEFDILTKQHLKCVIDAIQQADVFVFTLGLTEAWISTLDGSVFPACPGTVRGTYDKNKHQFKNFSANEIIQDTVEALNEIRSINKRIRFILSVSPVPLVATATDNHVLTATIYSKSALRVAAAEVCNMVSETIYFPAYEIITGPQAPHSFFQECRREPSKEGIDTVMKLLISRCGGSQVPEAAETSQEEESKMTKLSKAISEYDCEEAASGV